MMNLPRGVAVVGFGDGVEGATLPTGSEQHYRELPRRDRLGRQRRRRARSPLWSIARSVSAASRTRWPRPAVRMRKRSSGIRTNAPLSVLTLGRAVSIDDYQKLAASFAGIAQAYALWIPNGVNRGVFLTVAASDGQELPPGNLTLANLISALQAYGNPNVLVQAQSFLETLFGLEAERRLPARLWLTQSAQAAVNTCHPCPALLHVQLPQPHLWPGRVRR